MVQHRKSRGKGNHTPNEAEAGDQGKKKTETKKSSKSTSSKTTRSDNKASDKGTGTNKSTAPQEGEKEGDFEVDLEAMDKMPLKEKGEKGDSMKKNKKTNTMEKEMEIRGSTKKKAMFTETIENETTQAQQIEYKKRIGGFGIRVNKGNNTKGGFNKKLIEGLTFMQTYINKHASFHHRQGPNRKTHQRKDRYAKIPSKDEELL